MNEEKKQIIKGKILYKSEVLDHPNRYKKRTLLILEVNPEYLQALQLFGSEVDLNSYLEATLKPWPEDITDRAKKYFFTLRDRIAKAMGDETRDHKDHLYRSCVKELKYKAEDGSLKNSLSQLGRRELWQATELMYQWCYENESYVGDLIQERGNIMKEINK